MDEINEYLEKVFSAFPENEQTLTAKAELGQMMEDKYDDLIEEGKSHEEAINETIDEFGDPDELKSMFGENETGTGSDNEAANESKNPPLNMNTPVRSHGLPVFSRISISTVADIKIIEGDDYDVTCENFANQPSVNVENGTLYIRGGKDDRRIKGFSFLFISVRVDTSDTGLITITVPAGTKLHDISLSMGSGDIELSHINADNTSLKTLSGDIEIKDSHIDQLDTSSTSGDVTIKDLTAGKAKIGAVSGDIKGRGLSCDTFHVSTASGDSDLDFISYRNVGISAASGDITFITEQNIWKSDISVSTASGDIDVNRRSYRRDFRQEGTDGTSISIRTASGDCSIDHRESE